MSAVRIEDQGALRIWRLAKARGNAIDEPLVDDLLAAAGAAARDERVRGVLLASAHPTIFCPGLDLVALSAYDRPAMERFFAKFGEVIRTLFAFDKPVVAALAGHAVAGGCILALTADYRVLRRGGVQVGLNEVKVGVPLPRPVTVLLRATVAPPALAQVVLRGRNFADEEAQAMGLCDELAAAAGFEEVCLARLAELADKDPGAFSRTKGYLREEALRAMAARTDESIAEFLDGWFAEATRARIRAVVAALTAERDRD